ncbi:MAG TPA: divalent-cation tolerance protein CutA [Planctomycetota bacterium]|jgi:periplasmic divalent cation tolerance protein|nr:divalent-cation tolerance protein CutA [Planctomycetota bacterium]
MNPLPAELSVLLTTVDERLHADRLALGLLKARLVACVQILPAVTSHYWWKGELTTSEEWLVMAKLPRDKAAATRAWVEREHPYELPEILFLPVEDCLPAYGQWIYAQTREEGE